MTTSLADRARLFFVHWILAPPYIGWTLDEWTRMLRRHRYAIDAPFLPRAAFLTQTTISNTFFARREERKYAEQYMHTAVKEPLFILGHWRSGTTFLHGLLANDPQWSFPTPWQALNPRTFLSTYKYVERMRFIKPKTRMLDNMAVGEKEPFEDEVATCRSLCSPYLRWAFPRSSYDYDQYLTFRNAPAADLAAWKESLHLFFKKMTWLYDRPLLLKSPGHTGRIKILLDMFPDARFVHIHRNPYEVFRSCRRAEAIMSQVSRFQQPGDGDGSSEAHILKRFNELYDSFFEERALIPEGRICEVRYEELERDPVGHVRRVYDTLGLRGFDAMLPELQRYVAAARSYRKNSYAETPPQVRKTIASAWQRSFEMWDYAY